MRKSSWVQQNTPTRKEQLRGNSTAYVPKDCKAQVDPEIRSTASNDQNTDGWDCDNVRFHLNSKGGVGRLLTENGDENQEDGSSYTHFAELYNKKIDKIKTFVRL